MKAEPETKALIEMLYERIPELFDKPKREWVGLTAQEAADCWTTSATKTWHNLEAKQRCVMKSAKKAQANGLTGLRA